MPFLAAFRPFQKPAENALWFLFQGHNLLIKKQEEDYTVLEFPDLKALKLSPIHPLYLGSLAGRSCYAGELHDSKAITGPFAFVGIRETFFRFDQDLLHAAGLANQLVHWNQRHQYCGKCGSNIEDKTDERAKICPKCGATYYPRLSPAIIVAVVKDDQILLAHAKRFPAKFHSVLAGFVEPGETLEQCVEREVREEVGIAVKNIRYFGSQPWPFPDSLMIAFTAEYAGGDIHIDQTEIVHADWFSLNNLPVIPPSISIARQLIDWVSKRNRACHGQAGKS